jgi:hypothetical protein
MIGGPPAERAGSARLLGQLTVLLGLLVVLLSRLTIVVPPRAVVLAVGATFAVLEVVETPLLLRAPPHGCGARRRLVGTRLRSCLRRSLAGGRMAGALGELHLPLGGTVLGPFDTILGVAGLIVMMGGVVARGALDEVPTGGR